MYAYINKSVYEAFCTLHSLDVNLESSYLRFIKEFGTKSIIIHLTENNTLQNYKEFKDSACIRLRTETEWNTMLTQLLL